MTRENEKDKTFVCEVVVLQIHYQSNCMKVLSSVSVFEENVILQMKAGVELESRIIAEKADIYCSCLFPFGEEGFAVIARNGSKCSERMALLYQFGSPQSLRRTPLPEICGGGDLQRKDNIAAIITTEGIIYLKKQLISSEEKEKSSDIQIALVPYTELSIEISPRLQPSRESLPHIQIEANPQEFARLCREFKELGNESGIIREICGFMEQLNRIQRIHVIRSQANLALSNEQAPPTLRKEFIYCDKDQGLIRFHLESVEQKMVCLLQVIEVCGLACDKEIEPIVWEIMEKAERAAAALELRKAQNMYIAGSQTSEKKKKLSKEGRTSPMIDTESGMDADMADEEADRSKKMLADAINNVIRNRGLTLEELEKAGMSAVDAYYADLSRIEEIYEEIANFYKNYCENKRDANNYKTLKVMLRTAITSITAAEEEKAKINVSQRRSSGSDKGKFWTANKGLLNTFVMGFIKPAMSAYSEAECNPAEKAEIKQLCFKLAEIILREIHPKTSAQKTQRFTEYDPDYVDLRRKLLSILKSMDEIATLNMAYQYKDLEKILEICDKLGQYEPLYKLIEEWKHEQPEESNNNINKVFNWFIQAYNDEKVRFDPGEESKTASPEKPLLPNKAVIINCVFSLSSHLEAPNIRCLLSSL